jgi:hypothetical protein
MNWGVPAARRFPVEIAAPPGYNKRVRGVFRASAAVYYFFTGVFYI